MGTTLTGYLKPKESEENSNDPHHGDTVITAVTSGLLTGGEISSPSQPYPLTHTHKLHF